MFIRVFEIFAIYSALKFHRLLFITRIRVHTMCTYAILNEDIYDGIKLGEQSIRNIQASPVATKRKREDESHHRLDGLGVL